MFLSILSKFQLGHLYIVEHSVWKLSKNVSSQFWLKILKNETFLDNFQRCDIVVSIHPFSINDAKHREGGAGIFHADWI